ncbi:hypothetical protein VTI74DRAFT_1645 [Chaetomium olivicolor]
MATTAANAPRLCPSSWPPSTACWADVAHRPLTLSMPSTAFASASRRARLLPAHPHQPPMFPLPQPRPSPCLRRPVPAHNARSRTRPTTSALPTASGMCFPSSAATTSRTGTASAPASARSAARLSSAHTAAERIPTMPLPAHWARAAAASRPSAQQPQRAKTLSRPPPPRPPVPLPPSPRRPSARIRARTPSRPFQAALLPASPQRLPR